MIWVPVTFRAHLSTTLLVTRPGSFVSCFSGPTYPYAIAPECDIYNILRNEISQFEAMNIYFRAWTSLFTIVKNRLAIQVISL